ncbi:hypothetical protein AB0P05_26510 [Streptomyces flaveolus]|uniref:hypothetical protein n=1 Tax=Streptomyces flaveolus TaxID=67297 RepID=UPI00342BD127
MSCKQCGRDDGHYIGCDKAPGSGTELPSVPRERTRESECIKDGCTNPRAVSRGPRPAKYCDEHKTGSKK